nr:hypothetical protein [uncultured Sphingosinicella sp.]
MAEITLADYAGYIFREMIRARETADAYSRAVAEAYAKDEIMQHFSVPRFKVPTMQLTIPVLVSGARFAQTVRFVMPADAFMAFIAAQTQEVVGTVRASGQEPFQPRPPVTRPIEIRPLPTRPIVGRPIVTRTGGPVSPARAPEETVEALANTFWELLSSNPDPTKPNAIVQDMWPRIFERALADAQLVDQYKRTDPEGKSLAKSRAEVLQTISNNTAVSNTDIRSLLVNPETQVVKNGSTDASVFVIKADLTEEGFYIRSIKDDETGQVRPTVEFE